MLEPIDFPLELAHKYNRPGPRYTSYPTAPRFHTDYTGSDFLSDLRNDALHEQPLSLYVHLPFCRSLCHYCGCHMLVTHRPEKISAYVDVVIREIELIARTLGRRRKVVQVHWGGGTPTYLAPDDIERLMSHISTHFEILPHAEISIEADPRGLTREHLEAARRVGFNRISFGIQDLDPQVQEAIGRVQPVELVEEATTGAREAGFGGVSYDLIYGLPHQTPRRFAKTVEQVLELRPDRLSIFSYAHVPWMMRHQQLIDETLLPSTDDKLRILVETATTLTHDGGYAFIGMDHFALPEDGLTQALHDGTMQRNFQGYSTHSGSSLIGFGTSSISQLDGAYAQNEKDLRRYYDDVEHRRAPVFRGYRLTRDDIIRRRVIMDIMCRFALSFDQIERDFHIDFEEYFADSLLLLDEPEKDGLVDISNGELRVTDVGRFLVRNVAMPFDAHMGKTAHVKPAFSKTI